MKKKLGALGAIIIFLGLLFFVFGGSGEPRIENFDELQCDYERIVKVVQDYYEGLAESDDRITIQIVEGENDYSELKYNNSFIPLTEEKKNSLNRICTMSYAEYDFIWASSDYVIFWEDEMKQYGVLYAKKPKSVIKATKSWYVDLDYYKLNKNWYEIGYFGL